jgi:hypothetical protein
MKLFSILFSYPPLPFSILSGRVRVSLDYYDKLLIYVPAPFFLLLLPSKSFINKKIV